MTPQASHSSPHTDSRRAAPRRASRLRIMLLATSALASAALPAMAAPGDATWNPGNADFNADANWTGTPDKTTPVGIATFNASSQQTITFSKATTLGGITVTSDAGDYAFTTNNVGLTFTGAGLSVGSGASLTLNVNGPSIDPGGVLFEGSSTAGSSKWNVGNPAAPGAHAFLQFSEGSHADQAQITVLSGAGLSFIDSSTGDHATISNNAGGTVSFDTTKSA